MERKEIGGVKVAVLTADAMREMAAECRERLDICDEVIKTGGIRGKEVPASAREGAEAVRGACICLEKVALAAAEYEPARGDAPGAAVRYILAQLVNIFLGDEPRHLMQMGAAVMVKAAEMKMKQGKGAIVDAMFFNDGRDSSAAVH